MAKKRHENEKKLRAMMNGENYKFNKGKRKISNPIFVL